MLTFFNSSAIIRATNKKGDYVKLPPKDEALKKSGCFNNNHENVTASIFESAPFFDRKDIVQVKYEMIRAVTKDEGSVTEIADAYGFSRKSYYQTSEAFESGGLHALIPKKTGPKGPSKLNPEVVRFIDSYLAGHKVSVKCPDVLDYPPLP